MIEEKLLSCVVNDILNTKEFTLTTIAIHTHAPEEVVHDIAAGINTNPSSTLFRRIIKLHASLRPDLYQEIVNKIIHDPQQNLQEGEV